MDCFTENIIRKNLIYYINEDCIDKGLIRKTKATMIN